MRREWGYYVAGAVAIIGGLLVVAVASWADPPQQNTGPFGVYNFIVDYGQGNHNTQGSLMFDGQGNVSGTSLSNATTSGRFTCKENWRGTYSYNLYNLGGIWTLYVGVAANVTQVSGCLPQRPNHLNMFANGVRSDIDYPFDNEVLRVSSDHGNSQAYYNGAPVGPVLGWIVLPDNE